MTKMKAKFSYPHQMGYALKPRDGEQSFKNSARVLQNVSQISQALRSYLLVVMYNLQSCFFHKAVSASQYLQGLGSLEVLIHLFVFVNEVFLSLDIEFLLALLSNF